MTAERDYMKRYIWVVIAIVVLFVGLIISYSLIPPDRIAPGVPAANVEKLN
jgi:hypothetical protein